MPSSYCYTALNEFKYLWQEEQYCTKQLPKFQAQRNYNYFIKILAIRQPFNFPDFSWFIGVGSGPGISTTSIILHKHHTQKSACIESTVS